MKTVSDTNGQQRRQSPLKPTTIVFKDHFKTNREVIIPATKSQHFGLLLSQEKIPTLSQHHHYSQKETDDISIGGASAVTHLSPSKGPRFDQTFYSRKGSVKDSTDNLMKDYYSNKFKKELGSRQKTESMSHLFRNQTSTLSVGVASTSMGEESNIMTTDDLLRAAIVKTKTRQDKNKFTTYESQEPKGQPSQAAGGFNSNKRMHLTTNMAKLTHATNKKHSVTQMLFGEGTNSQTTLPQVSEISYDVNYSQGHMSHRKHSNSKVMVSNTDMQSYLANGTLSKEFIQSNKKELEAFIKNQVRSGGTNDMFKGFKEITGLSKEQAQALGVNTSIGAVKEDENRFPRTKRSLSFAQSDLEVTQAMESKLRKVSNSESRPDQKPEKGFKTAETAISNRVIEMWLNETLQDAERMEIPQVLLKPENKKPIIRYGIERFTLQKAGLSHDQIDRIYRSLFVYSVGFFELLKNTFAFSNQSYELIVSLWKVFHVLLEYCCKTDYQVMITEITLAYGREKSQMEETFSKKIETYVENERVLKSNMDTMQTFQDKLEREKANERQLRLKLEEEYMQNSKNHEEEVQLRLKFEQKLNEMHRDKRKLQIMYDRCVQELNDALQTSVSFEKLASSQSVELVDLKQRELNHLYIIQAQSEKIDSLQKDLNRKNDIVEAHYKSIADSNEKVGLMAYELSDALKLMNEAEMMSNSNLKANFELTMVNTDLNKQIKDLKNEIANRTTEFQTWQQLFFDLQTELSKAQADFIKSSEIVAGQKDLVTFLRLEQETLSKEVAVLKVHDEKQQFNIRTLTKDLKLRQQELDQNMQRLHLINKERHHYKRRFQEKREKNKLLKNELDQNKKALQNAEETINQLYKNVSFLTADVERLKENGRKLERSLIEKITRFEHDNLQLKVRQTELNKKNMNYAELCEQLKIQVLSLEEQILAAHEARRIAEVKLHEAQMFAAQCEAEVLEEKHKADRFKVQAVESGIEAEEARQITMKFESAVRLFSKQMNEEQAAHRKQVLSLENQVSLLNSCSQMEVEDMRSRYYEFHLESLYAKNLIRRVNNIQETIAELEFYQGQCETLGRKAKEFESLYLQSTSSLSLKLKETEDRYKKLLVEETTRHRLEVNNLEQNAASNGAISAQAAMRYLQEISELKKHVHLLEYTLRKGGKADPKILSKLNSQDVFLEKSTQTKGSGLTKILPLFDIDKGQNRRSITPDVVQKDSKLKIPITEGQLKQLKEWKDKINIWTVQIKKTANLQTTLVTKYVAHLDELRRQNVEIPIEVRRTQLNLLNSSELSQNEVKKTSKKSSLSKGTNQLETLLSNKSSSKKSELRDLLQNVGQGGQSDDFMKKARQAAINQGLDEAEVERFLENLAHGDNDSEYDSQEDISEPSRSRFDVGNYQPNGDQKKDKSAVKKKVYGKVKEMKIARFADPSKSQEENDADRYDAFKDWILKQEMEIMEKMQQDHELDQTKMIETEEEKKEESKTHLNDIYKQLREKILVNIPYEFKILKLSDAQKQELAEVSKQQAEDFMYSIELENELVKEELQEALESQRSDIELVVTDRKRTKKIINFKEIIDAQSAEYLDILDSLLQIKRDAQAAKARDAQKSHFMKDNIAHIKGKRANVFLIPMAIELSYTLYHQKLLKEGMKQAAKDFFDRPGVLKRLAEERQKLEDHKHKLWLERHKQKLARIEIVREDLMLKKDQELLKKLEEQSRQIEETIRQREIEREQIKEIDLTVSFAQLDLVLQEMLDEVDVEEKDGGFFITGKEVDLDESSLIQEKTPKAKGTESPLDIGDLSKVIEGGVAAQNKSALEAKKREEQAQRQRMDEIKRRADQKDEVLQRDESEERSKPRKLGPSSIRTLIRAADSRRN